VGEERKVVAHTLTRTSGGRWQAENEVRRSSEKGGTNLRRANRERSEKHRTE